MKSEIARKLRLKRDKDISPRLIIEHYNESKKARKPEYKMEFLDDLIRAGHTVIGEKDGEEFTLESIDRTKTSYPIKYKERYCWDKLPFDKLTKLV